MSRLRRTLLYVLLALYLSAVLFVSAIRFWVIPNLQQWQAPLEKVLSEALGVELSFEQVSGEWKGSRARIQIDNVRVQQGEGQQPAMHIPLLKFEFSWSSWLYAKPIFHMVYAEGLQLTIQRDANADIRVGGVLVDEGTNTNQAPPAGEEEAVLRWLALQRQVQFANATIIWEDTYRQLPPEIISPVQIDVQNRDGRHYVALQEGTAEQPEGLAVLADLRSPVEEGDNLEAMDGQLYMRARTGFESLLALGLDKNTDWSVYPESLELLVNVEKGRFTDIRFKAEASDLHGAFYGQQLAAQKMSVFMSSSWADLDRWLGQRDWQSTAPVQSMAVMQGVKIGAGQLWQEDLFLDRLAVELDGRGRAWQLNTFLVENEELYLHAQGNWRPDPDYELGWLDLQGRLEHVQLSTLYKYFPDDVGEDVIVWLKAGLQKGWLEQGKFTLQGDVDAFPFQSEQDKGYFDVTAAVRDAQIDYWQASARERTWPVLRDIQGQLRVERAGLYGTFTQASVLIDPASPVQATKLDITIPNMEHDSIVHIDAQSHGSAASYAPLFKNSPLGEMVNHELDALRAEGQWDVPLKLAVPLQAGKPVTVAGHVAMQNTALRVYDYLPPMRRLQGRLYFTEDAVWAENLRGSWLGQPLTIEKGVAYEGNQPAKYPGLTFKGSVDMQQARPWIPAMWHERVQGRTPFQFVLNVLPSDVVLTFDSDLNGLIVDMPLPMQKPAEQRWPLQLRWQGAGPTTSQLSVALGRSFYASFLHDTANPSPYFKAGTITANKEVRPEQNGLVVDVHYPKVDLDGWLALIQTAQADESQGEEYFPALKRLRVQADEAQALGMGFEQLTLTAQQPQQRHWRVDISSSEAAGNLQWQVDREGEIEGVLQAHFQRIILGEMAENEVGEDTESERWGDDALHLPDMNLHIEQLEIAGKRIGSVLAEGRSETDSDVWQLEELSLVAPGVSLSGTGHWLLNGESRGLYIEAQAAIENLQDYLNFFGVQDVVRGTKGSVAMQFNWRNLPWRVALDDLEGDINIVLGKGRLNQIQSRSARLLELLSLQSLTRLARLELNIGGVLREGFPYDEMRGDISLREMQLHTNNYRIIGPVGTIVIEGDVGVKSESLALNVVVIPRVDVSGAAVAAAIAVNPVVGIGAFLAQWLLQEPLSRAMTQRYAVHGSWDDPQLEEMSLD
ncbi:YhdP family protein [Paenalcaligenes sp. Me52]|uniref:YhdP family protein n=1 Tax=Paenalcaligenes sp. Me52 TaxID=3392038 RepID=UPI003D28BBB2